MTRGIMAQRTTISAVAAVLVDSSLSSHGQGDYDGTTSLQPYIDAGSSVVDDLEAADDAGVLTAAKMALIECWVAAHFYTIMDPIYVSKSTAGASASFQQRKYLDVAVMLDPTGMLNAIVLNQRASGFWLGTAQDQYDDRFEP